MMFSVFLADLFSGVWSPRCRVDSIKLVDAGAKPFESHFCNLREKTSGRDQSDDQRSVSDLRQRQMNQFVHSYMYKILLMVKMVRLPDLLLAVKIILRGL